MGNMSNKIKHKTMPVNAFKAARLWLCFLALFTSLAACSQSHIPLGEYRIEWEEFNSKLHGQTVIFNKPMSYAHFEAEDINYGWRKEYIEIGRMLWRSNSDGISVYEPKLVKDGMEFIVKASFWHRVDWFSRDINGDIHKILLIDENGIESTISFIGLADSNRADLMVFKNQGKYD